jgi:poly(A) polymerase
MAIDLETFVLDPQHFQIIDPVGGRSDSMSRVINAVSETVFKADPARLLRAVRLAAELNFEIGAETEALIRRFNRLVERVAGERVREELLRILATHRAGYFIRYLDDLGY